MRFASGRIRTVLVLAVAGLGVESAHAGKTIFNPSLGVEAGYNDNLRNSVGETEDDAVAGFTVELPVDREWRTGDLSFDYRLDVLRYDEFTELNRDEHRMFFELESRPNRFTRYRFDTNFRRTQIQGVSTSTDGSDLFLVNRTDRDLFRIGFEFDP